jgi:hypothetical protein
MVWPVSPFFGSAGSDFSSSLARIDLPAGKGLAFSAGSNAVGTPKKECLLGTRRAQRGEELLDSLLDIGIPE